jgi:haloalkane dehalogenase
VKRRDILTTSVGAIMASAIGVSAFGQPSSAPSPSEDDAAARRYDRERRFAETTFGRIAHIDRGKGAAVVFLHGFPLSSFQWRGAIDRLSAHRRCLAPDLMGLGHTEVAPGQSVTPAAQADMIAAFLDRIGIDRVDLIGSDSGGVVAQLFVTKYPQRVSSPPRSARRSSTATYWVSHPIRSRASRRCCVHARSRYASSGA